MQSLQDTYSRAVTTLMVAVHEAEQEAARVDALLDALYALVRPRRLGVKLQPAGEWHNITLTTPSGGAVVVGQVKETSELTIGRLHETVGTPFFVRSVDTLAAKAARDAKREARTGAIGLAALGLLVAGVLYAVL